MQQQPSEDRSASPLSELRMRHPPPPPAARHNDWDDEHVAHRPAQDRSPADEDHFDASNSSSIPNSGRRQVAPFELVGGEDYCDHDDDDNDNGNTNHRRGGGGDDEERLLPRDPNPHTHPRSSFFASKSLVSDEDGRALDGDGIDSDGPAYPSDDRKEQTLYPVEIGGGGSLSDADDARQGFRGGSSTNSLEDWLYPPHLPRSCQLLRRENLAVPACYLLVGVLQGLSSPLVNVLPLDLGATEAQQTTVSAIRSLPASFKLLFGFWSDNVPVGGLRRKPYMLMGWVVASLSMLVLMGTSNLNIPSRNSGCFGGGSGVGNGNSTAGSTDAAFNNNNNSATAVPAGVVVIPDDAPSIQLFSVTLLCFGIGYWLADVMGDSIVAEKAKLEPAHARGTVQSSCYSYRFFGLMVAAPYSTYLYSAHGPEAVVRLLALLPLAIVPLVLMLHEPALEAVRSTRDQCLEIWNTVCSRSVWQPMGFVYAYNVMQVSNAAWREYLVTVLDFTSCQLNLILIFAYVLLYLGIMCYKHYMIAWSWRKVYVATTTLNGVFSLGQVLLIRGITFGMSPFWFALGDDAFSEFIAGVQFLPTTIMMVHLCPTGSEGASYAMFTTVNNAALTLSSAISTRLLGLWPVDKATLDGGDLSGMLNLTYLTTVLQVSAVLLVGLLPRYKEDLIALHQSRSGSSIVGGAAFLCITFGSILYAVGVGVRNIVNPGWMGES